MIEWIRSQLDLFDLLIITIVGLVTFYYFRSKRASGDKETSQLRSRGPSHATAPKVLSGTESPIAKMREEGRQVNTFLKLVSNK